MDKNWTKIFSSSQLYKVEIIKGLLSENNIVSIEINKQDSAYLFGEIELYVKVEDAFQAKQIIVKYNSE
jgi:hypothetical protein